MSMSIMSTGVDFVDRPVHVNKPENLLGDLEAVACFIVEVLPSENVDGLGGLVGNGDEAECLVDDGTGVGPLAGALIENLNDLDGLLVSLILTANGVDLRNAEGMR